MDITLTIKAEPKLLKVLERFVGAVELKENPKTKPAEVKNSTPQIQTPVTQPIQQQSMPANPASIAPIQPVMPQTQPTAPGPQQPAQMIASVPQPVPTMVQTYTMDQLAKAGTQLIDAGKLTELQQLLASFGVQALTMLPKEQYGAFATQLRSLGAKI